LSQNFGGGLGEFGARLDFVVVGLGVFNQGGAVRTSRVSRGAASADKDEKLPQG